MPPPAEPLTEVLGIEPDVIFDIAVEANRPDAWSVAGVARDLAARLGLAFAIPDAPVPAGGGPSSDDSEGGDGGVRASVRVDDLELCPRFTARVITGVAVGPSPRWLARRLSLAGMRPINNVVDASNYVMLELGQPTHPYDLDRLAGGGLIVRRAEPGETVTTLDGIQRTLGRPGPGLGDTGQDCLICDAEGSPVGIGGIMGGASSEIGPGTSRVLLEAAYFVPMAIARTSKRLALRTEASARFERGCDPEGIDRAAARFCQLLALTAGPDLAVAGEVTDIRGRVPGPVVVPVRVGRVNGLLGAAFSPDDIVGLLEPLGMTVGAGPDGVLEVTVPTFRPDIRPAPQGEADITEEVARTYGYSRLARGTPSWPQPGRLTQYQKDRRILREVVAGLGATEAWTETFVTEADQWASAAEPPWIEVSNPLVESERFLRSSMLPGLIRAVAHNAERRQGDVRLFEVGSVFLRTGVPPAVDPSEVTDGSGFDEPERLSAVFAHGADDAWTTVAAWRTIADAVGIAHWELGAAGDAGPVGRVLHPYRSASILGTGGLGSWAWWARSTPPWWAGSACSARTDGRVGWAGSIWTSASCSTGSGCGGGPRRHGRSAGTRRPTSTWPSWSPRRWTPARSNAPSAPPPASCWSPSGSSTCTGAVGPRRCPQPGLPTALLRAGPHPGRRGDRRPPHHVHRRGGVAAALSAPRLSALGVEAHPQPVERPEPQVPPAVVPIGVGHGPAGQLDARRNGRARGGRGSVCR